MANKFLSGINVTGTTTLNTVANAGTDTDKFLVLDASGNVDFRTGDELYADLGIGSLPSGFTSTLKHAVKAGVALTKGQAVYVTSADGTNMIVGKASNASEATSSKTLGLIETALSINGIGNVITEGLLTGLDTTGAAAAGDPVWLGTDGNLIYGLLNKPYAPAHLVFIGVVTRINANNGEIFVKVQNGFELREIHDVDLITTTPINGHILGYNGTLWVNKTIAGWLGYTPADDSLVVKLAGTQTITGTKTFTQNVTLNKGALIDSGYALAWSPNEYVEGSSVSNSLKFATSGLYRLELNSTGIFRLNAYTTNGLLKTSSGNGTFAIATPSTDYVIPSDLSSYVPTTRTLTINGTTYDLSADRSWTIEAGGGTSASTRTIQKFTSTASQTTFTITGGYTVGMVDVWVNGVKLDNAVDFTASNGTTVVLTDALTASQIVEVYKYGSQFIVNNGLRQKTLFTATAGQTTFTVAYSVGLVDVYYNGSKLDDSEFTATNGTSIVLGTACAVNDKVEVIAFSYNVNGFTGIGGSGTINNIPKFTATGTIGDSAITDNGTTVTLVSRALSGTSATFSGNLGINTSTPDILGYGTKTFGILGVGSDFPNMQIGIPGTSAATTDVMGDINFYSRNGTSAVVSRSLIRSGLDGATNSNYFNFFTMNAGTLTERMRITSGGYFKASNTGTYLGSTGAYHELRQSAQSTASVVVSASNASFDNNVVAIGSTRTASSAFNLIAAYANDFNDLKFVVRGDGNVGIGTSSPNSILEIQRDTNGDTPITFINGSGGSGNTNASISLNFTLRNGSGGSSGGVILKAGKETDHIGTNVNDYFAISTTRNDAMGERMRITSGGVVKINAFTSNGLVGTDASGNLGVVNSTYTEVAVSTYSKPTGAPNMSNGNQVASDLRNHNYNTLVWGTGGDQVSQNQGAGVSMDFGSARAIRRISLYAYNVNPIDTWRVDYSDDNSNWTALQSFPNIYGAPLVFDFNRTSTESHRYWRIIISSWTLRDATNWYVMECVPYI